MKQGVNNRYRRVRGTGKFLAWRAGTFYYSVRLSCKETSQKEQRYRCPGDRHKARSTRQGFDIAYELGEATDFEIFITVVNFTREDLYSIYSLGSPFIANVVRDGIILHDDGTFAGLLKQVPSGR